MDPARPPGDQRLPRRCPCGHGLLSTPDPAGPTAQSPPYIPAIAESFIGFAVGIVLAAVAAAIAESATGYKPSSGSAVPVAVTAANLIGLWTGLAGAAVIISRRKGTGRLSTDYGFRIGAWWDVPLGAAVGLACQYGLIPLLYLPFEQLDASLSRRLSKPAHQFADAAHGPLAVVLIFALLAVGAPLVEELYFRGLLQRSLLTRLPPAAAIATTSVLFALAHFEAVQFAGLAVFGAILGYMAWRTGRLGPSVAAHMAFNAAAVAAVVHLR
jgi:membrane protease YdiL (CAAX protease family)